MCILLKEQYIKDILYDAHSKTVVRSYYLFATFKTESE